MEIRVTVDNDDKIVRGIGDNTSVSDVIYALADTVGRKGRFSLVRKTAHSEKILAPSDKIVEILKKKAKSKDVTYIMKRTSELNGDETIKPERSPKRKSLPPNRKRRPKPSEVNSATSKSPANNNNNNHTERVRPASALGTTSSLDRATYRSKRNSGLQDSRGTDHHNSNQRLYSNLSTFQPTTKPTTRQSPAPEQRPMSSASRTTNVSNKVAAFDARSQSSTMEHAVRRRPRTPTSSLPRQRRPLSSTGSSSADKSAMKKHFHQLLLDHHTTIVQYDDIINRLDSEYQQHNQVLASKLEKSSDFKDLQSIQLEMKNVKDTIENNEKVLTSEEALLDRLNDQEQQTIIMQVEVTKLKSDAALTERNLQQAKQNIATLENEIELAKKLHQERKKKAISNGLKLEMRKLNVESSRLNEMLRTTQKGVDDVNASIQEKTVLLDSLNREIRQVSLQQFICETGTKVTVLPSEQATDKTKRLQGILKMPRLNEQVSTEESSGGYWV